MHKRTLLLLIGVTVIASCKGQTAAPPAQPVATVALSQADFNLPPIPGNQPVAADGELTLRQLEVTESADANPGQPCVLIDRATNTLLVSGVIIDRAYWDVGAPGMTAQYPAKGAVFVLLADNQWEAVKKAGKLAIQPLHPGPARFVGPLGGGNATPAPNEAATGN